MAGGMGWGIRGQYGHETGAMIAGLLVSLVLVLFLGRPVSASAAARVVAWGTLAMGFGGSMTYGQTIGLTQDAGLIGNQAAWRWGMLGLAVKGGVWIGWAGLFLGMGWGGRRYGGRDLAIMMGLALALYWLGHRLLNEPFDPGRKVLPAVYFSASWQWQPYATLQPRPECWGGLLLALAGLIAWVTWRKQDRLAWRLAGWGLLGGAVGFPLGQSLQAWHAWHPEFFRAGFLARAAPVINWWNMMEITFGAVMGAALGWGAWWCRARIRPAEDDPSDLLPGAVDLALLPPFLAILVTVEFAAVGWVDRFFDLGLALGLLPMIMVASGRWWRFLVVFPLTLLPIAGKTIRSLGFEQAALAPWLAVTVCGVLPVGASIAMLAWSVARARAGQTGQDFARHALLFSAWLYLGLNFAFFRFPWPWAKWTARTPSALIFFACALGLTALVVLSARRPGRPLDAESPLRSTAPRS